MLNLPQSIYDSLSDTDEGNSVEPLHVDDIYDDILNDYDVYGSTPTRTRISRKLKERKQWEKERGIVKPQTSKTTRTRNSSDQPIFDLDKGESSGDETDSQKSTSKGKKRHLKLLRGSERDFKLDFSDMNHSSAPFCEIEAEMPGEAAPTIKVETCKPFMCLSSKLVLCRKSGQNVPCNIDTAVNQDRLNFHQTLLRIGNCDKVYGQEHIKQQMLDAETCMPQNDVWQSELKDLLWLELRAYLADRTPSEQDQFFCREREGIGDLLKSIMEFRLDEKSVVTDAENDGKSHCSKWCFKMFCTNCQEVQNVALRRIESLLFKLENAAALYPSSRTFGIHYPLYVSKEFTAKVKTMCLWYNLIKHMRLKFLILCRQLIQAEELNFSNPKQLLNSVSSDSHGSSLSMSTDPSEPATSNHSDETTADEDFEYNFSGLYFYRVGEKKYELDYYNLLPDIRQHFHENGNNPSQDLKCSFPMSAYRKYIKNNLKTKGIKRAFNFIEKLENTVLQKIKWSLMELTEEEWEKIENTSDNCDISEELELKRHGMCSEEAQSLCLPGYRSCFLFIARIPLCVIHTFLLMRLNMRPEKPSLLSIRQLICELKEGLRLAVTVRKHYLEQFEAATRGAPPDVKVDSYIDSFDQTTQNVLEIYLKYLYQWVSMIQQEQVWKNVLEEEWGFAKNISPHIPGGLALVGSSFCLVARTIFQGIDNLFRSSVDELVSKLKNAGPSEIKHEMFRALRAVQSLVGITRERALRSICLVKILRKDLENVDQENTRLSLHYNVITDALVQLKQETCTLCVTIKYVVKQIENSCVIPSSLDEIENCALRSRIREVLNQLFKFAFEYYKEVFRMTSNCMHTQFSECIIGLANLWINFVKERCEQGRGLKPKWATQGLDYLVVACDPQHTDYLSDEKFQSFKAAVEDIIDYIVGTQDNHSPHICKKLLFNSSPRSQASTPPIFPAAGTPRFRRRYDGSHSINGYEKRLSVESCENSPSPEITFEPLSRRGRVQSAVKSLDSAIEKRLKNENRIGEVCETYNSTLNIHSFVKYHTINFSWQRGIKIGQGRFGKVYTVVNHENGELLAMKELQLQPNDHQAVTKVVQELNIFERVNHENLVRYYGVEIHKEEMLIFMELCPEGTLENLVASIEGGFPESIIRGYMRQLVAGVDFLHQHGIVHRDIKSANIFLTKEGRCLKLGDFGSAAKMKAHLTVPGELIGFVGTQAYMAPEVFTKNNTVGHGRAVDIWSLGCVLVEMASGQRPWAEYDSNYQIMFKVGMGETPHVPDSLSDEGHSFANLCLQHCPKDRATTTELSQHLFLKIDND
ncbi:mitogen-activated protein kinase kinase kinase 4 isoform X2 [Bemisia tabaci]|uniref:mitogen-activated protein kinase kinase kinase 4 isoform X2 n=1 Tax=Bemisia tabaci TaxID=7038 RepID=UPI003B28B6A9